MNKRLLLFLPSLLISLISCNTSREKQGELTVQTDSLEQAQGEGPAISFYFYEEKNDYPDAIIEMYTPLGNQKFRPGKVPFEFNIKNYPFASGMGGFQLMMILNGGDPVGYNAPIFQRELKEGTYRAVAYLVDAEGLALKEFGNYVDRDFMVGETRAFPYQAEPYIAVNLPRNGQVFPEGQEATVDFLVLGGDLKLDKLKVRIQLDAAEYELDQMTPVRIANLPKGEYALTVSLLKKDGKELDGPFSSVQKTIIIQ
ncbi:hypothetical protein [Cecembia calidifontis]|jgi:hypothetical protein|uniref:Uncharacterized protein n=1 Tax=Cecembia calidifontis TaxID=1187080 RepID=A0A4Q7PAR3_9BACT|nr:hypothetical protein [Cecembia calidifontis]RZS95852.1 hypothetical protein BC751_1402 [Cecembia calidifontis]